MGRNRGTGRAGGRGDSTRGPGLTGAIQEAIADGLRPIRGPRWKTGDGTVDEGTGWEQIRLVARRPQRDLDVGNGLDAAHVGVVIQVLDETDAGSDGPDGPEPHQPW